MHVNLILKRVQHRHLDAIFILFYPNIKILSSFYSQSMFSWDSPSQ